VRIACADSFGPASPEVTMTFRGGVGLRIAARNAA
jgi:hypothetical protein